MRQKNQKHKQNHNFNCGNLLEPPCDKQTFIQQSKLLQEQKKRLNGVTMLNNSPQFGKKQRDSDYIDSGSDIEHFPSQSKTYRDAVFVPHMKGRKKEYSQFEDQESQTNDEPQKKERNYLNPQKSSSKSENPKHNLSQNSYFRPFSYQYNPSLPLRKRESFYKSPIQQFSEINNIQNDYQDDTDF